MGSDKISFRFAANGGAEYVVISEGEGIEFFDCKKKLNRIYRCSVFK